jgi:Rad3-related DNA helicase
LQKQYGNGLKADEDFKVVMGTGNYKCSFFKDKYNQRMDASNSWCRNYDVGFHDYWGDRILAKKGEIETIHEDQDDTVLQDLEKKSRDVENDMLDIEDTLRENDELMLYRIKKCCTENKACSFYLARGIADEAIVAIRSIQHLMFYIMYQVGGENPILQEREIHIHDESHSLESVFRDFFSAKFTQTSYEDALNDINIDIEDGVIDGIKVGVIEDFNSLRPEGHKGPWSQQEVHIACKAIEKNLAVVVENTAMFAENRIRESVKKELVKDAFEFMKIMASGELVSDPDAINGKVKRVVGWYKNLYTSNLDHTKYLRAKAEGQRYQKRYGAQIQMVKGSAEIHSYPLSMEKMADRYFGSKHTVFMSATPPSQAVFEKMFGLAGEVGYVEIDSGFPPERSPILFDPVVTNTSDSAKALGLQFVNPNLFKDNYSFEQAAKKVGQEKIHEKLSIKILEILKKFPKVAGIIPCVSYRSVELLKESLGEDKRFIWATESSKNIPSIEEFKGRSRDGEPVFLVSAGISEGHSFDDALSRIQILTKMPYPAMDSVMTDLCARWGGGYYNARTAAALQQTVGRSMRSSGDYCLTILLDTKFDVLKNDKLHKHYSKHFLKCLDWDKDWRSYSFPNND